MPPLRITETFTELLDKKDPKLQASIAKAVSLLGTNPRHPGLETHIVRGTADPKIFEARVDRKNRLTFHWDGPMVVLRVNCHHDILKNP